MNGCFVSSTILKCIFPGNQSSATSTPLCTTYLQPTTQKPKYQVLRWRGKSCEDSEAILLVNNAWIRFLSFSFGNTSIVDAEMQENEAGIIHWQKSRVMQCLSGRRDQLARLHNIFSARKYHKMTPHYIDNPWRKCINLCIFNQLLNFTTNLWGKKHAAFQNPPGFGPLSNEVVWSAPHRAKRTWALTSFPLGK